MKIVALEEHLITREVLDAWSTAPDEAQERNVAANSRQPAGDRLLDLGEGRLAAMDDQGVDVQVLSLTQPGLQNLTAEIAVPLASATNDRIAATIEARPDRFEGFAALPTADPTAAGNELRRAVGELGLKGAMLYGRTGTQNLDDPTLDPIWAAASALRAPLYLHPQRPQLPVRDIYYSGFSPQVDFALSSVAIGWHFETGMQLIRMIYSGVFHRYPDLQLVIGHWGELVLWWEERFTSMQKEGALPAGPTLLDTLRQHVYFTGSGDLSQRSLRWTQEVIGADRLLYATDYPFIDTSAGQARTFLEAADLTENYRDGIAHANWDRLTAHLR